MCVVLAGWFFCSFFCLKMLFFLFYNSDTLKVYTNDVSRKVHSLVWSMLIFLFTHYFYMLLVVKIRLGGIYTDMSLKSLVNRFVMLLQSRFDLLSFCLLCFFLLYLLVVWLLLNQWFPTEVFWEKTIECICKNPISN